ncbi:MAG: DUF58 domain-containing protein [Phycisphaeraceae bacterium]|nr:DUF58 domain-containing protein [Phycisphaerales bacterium]MCB9841921.1 DUF58 domain-containing protein [Phycisphaeraceae bacterium]
MSPPTTPTQPTRLPEGDASLYLHPQTLARLGTFELRAKMVVEGVMSGMHRSPYHGFSVEFAQHRPYVSGDDLRHLDWKVFGRTDKLYLKQYEQETSLDLVLLVDASGSMSFGSRTFADASGVGRKESPDGRLHWSKFDHATATAAAFGYMALRQGDRVGLGVFADHLRIALERSGAQGHWRRIVGALSTHTVDKPTDIGRVVDEVLAKLNNRCLLVIISDLFADPAQIRTALARIRHKRHDAILFQIVDRRERFFDINDAAPFEGLEGEGRIRLDPRAIRTAYRQAFEDHLDKIEKITRSFGFDYQLVNTHEWLGPHLAAFVARRNAVLKRLKSG